MRFIKNAPKNVFGLNDSALYNVPVDLKVMYINISIDEYIGMHDHMCNIC